MKKSPKGKKPNKKGVIDPLDVELEEEEVVTPEAAEDIDPEVLKVLSKPVKKPKAVIDATDYIPELEREDLPEDTDVGGNF